LHKCETFKYKGAYNENRTILLHRDWKRSSIAKSIKKSLTGVNQETKLIPINTLDLSKKIVTSAERVGVIYPTYAMSAPSIVKTFASQLRVSSGSYVFLYAHSGGGGTTGSLYAINRILTENGVSISNTFETAFPSNSAMVAYTPEKVDTVLDKAEVSLKLNIKPIVNKEENKVIKPNVFKNVSSTLTEKMVGVVENIELKNGTPEFADNCTMCMSCINQCPKKSLAFGKMKKEKLLSYRHPEVELKELMYR